VSNFIQMLKPKTKAQTTTMFAWALIAPAALVMFWIVLCLYMKPFDCLLLIQTLEP